MEFFIEKKFKEVKDILNHPRAGDIVCLKCGWIVGVQVKRPNAIMFTDEMHDCKKDFNWEDTLESKESKEFYKMLGYDVDNLPSPLPPNLKRSGFRGENL